jgi:hypothetical protein
MLKTHVRLTFLKWTSSCVHFLLITLAPLLFLVNAIPPGFIVDVVSSPSATILLPTNGLFAPNPRKGNEPMLIVTYKTGEVNVYEDPDVSSLSIGILDLANNNRMCTNGERGLQSIAVHPNFQSNRFVYLYYTMFKEGCLAEGLGETPWNVLARFVMNATTLQLDFDSRTEIWR